MRWWPRSSMAWAAVVAWAAAVVLAVVPLFLHDSLHPARFLVVVAAAAAVTLTIGLWLRRMSMPAARAFQLGYRQGLSDGARLGKELTNVVDLRHREPRPPTRSPHRSGQPPDPDEPPFDDDTAV